VVENIDEKLLMPVQGDCNCFEKGEKLDILTS
jgi:hypothetical protein